MHTGLGAAIRLLAAGLVACISACLGACDRPDTAADVQPVASPTAASTSFAGSAACAECHAAEQAAWKGSHHELAMQHADADSVLGDFDDARFDYFGETTRFFRDGDDFRVETAGADGEPARFTVAYTFGIEPLQQYLVPFPAGRLQVLPYAWDTRPAAAGGQRWFHLYPDEHIAPGDILHWTTRQQNWNYMCAECHSTNLVMGYDEAGDRYATTFSEVSVGCEACHGPGSQHISEARAGRFANSRYGLVVDLDDQDRAVWRMNAATGIAARSEPAMRAPQQPESCGRCHSRRGVLTDEYEYGRPLTDTHMPSLLEDGLYFADGQIRDEVYVYGSFLQSRMYRAGVTCSNCHDPHSLELKTGAEPDAVCAQCHLPAVFAATGHTGHAAGAVACVDCHMPERTYMVVDPRRDHGFRVPRPDLAAKLGTPDVCANCHADRTAGWAAGSLAALHGKPGRPEFATALDAARRGEANAKLLGILAEGSTPGIVRATALELFAPPMGEPEVRVLAAGLDDPDPLVRLAAVRVARLAPPEFRLQYGTARLDDDVRAVRLEAAMTFADMRDMLPPGARTAFAGAEDEFVHSQAIQLDRPEAWVSLGDLAAALGDVDAALGRYERAMAMQPLLVRARVNMADALRRQGDDARGREVLEAGIALVPDAAALHHALGLLLVRQRELGAALAALETAVELEPGNPRYRYVLDVARSEIGQPVPD